jgi:voltage-gated potassium channel
MSLFMQLLIGGFMIGVTVMVHAVALDFIIKNARFAETVIKTIFKSSWRPVMAGTIVVSSFVSHIVQIWLWAFLYTIVDAQPLENFSETLYFATVTYTTLGYGDLTLNPSFRMLSAVEGANGFLLFGWTTAFIFEVIAELYEQEAQEL